MESIDRYLKQNVDEDSLRTLKPATLRKQGKRYIKEKEFIDLSSNDYLSLSNHPKLKQAMVESIEKLGVGASASRLLSGDLDIYHTLEERIASFKNKEAGLVFNSGYQANTGIIPALCSREDVIFSDKLNHASIIDGMVLSNAKVFRFKHNDINHLEELLKEQRPKFKSSLIITETVFSMDGDKTPLAGIVSLAKKYNSKIMVDEAHATGVFGENGTGLVEELGLTENIDFIMGTFSKALGVFGAYFACSAKIKNYLINACRSFIYSTALPPSIIAANLVSLDLVSEESNRRIELLSNAEYFRNKLKGLGFEVKGSSQIIPMIIGNSKKAVTLSCELQKKGWWVQPIRPPTVPQGEARLRFSLTYYHKKEVLDRLIKDISEISND